MLLFQFYLLTIGFKKGLYAFKAYIAITVAFLLQFQLVYDPLGNLT